MWVKHCHKPPMTGNGFYIPPIKNDDDCGMVYDFVLTTLVMVSVKKTLSGYVTGCDLAAMAEFDD